MATENVPVSAPGVTVTFDAEDGVAVVTLALPGKVNKINPAFGAALSAGLDAALGLKGLKGVILASGHKDFCVGADIDVVYASRDPQRDPRRRRPAQRGLSAHRDLRQARRRRAHGLGLGRRL
jgi:enoyl-CoA hydratase/carnithine racemase